MPHLTRIFARTVMGLLVAANGIDPAAAAIGRTEASYSVTQDGDAAYTVPIRVTEGFGRVTPNIAITYVGPGTRTILGVGFSLSGISMISPCRKTIAQDLDAAPVTLTSTDKYCLDGNRLRLVSGTHGLSGAKYRTELDKLIQVTVLGSSNGIPTSFKAEMPDGMEYEYGATPDSKLLASAAAGAPPQLWAVNKVTDSSGNYATYVYDTNNAARRFRPNYIAYAANDANGDGNDPHYRLTFVYGTTITPTLKYTPSVAGGAAKSDDKRLTALELSHDSSVYRKYVLGYGTGAGSNSRLTTISECIPGSPDDCLGSTTLVWQSATSGHNNANTGPNVASGAIPLDINGDGADDLVWAASGTWRYTLSSSTGYGSAINTSIAAVNPSKAMPLDWNGDGLQDLIIDWSDGKWRVIEGTKTGLDSTAQNAAAGTQISTLTSSTSWTIADVNSDGRDDLLRMDLNSQLAINAHFGGPFGLSSVTQVYSSTVFRTQSKGFIPINGASAIRRPDFNGDGRTDFLIWACPWEQELGQCVAAYRWVQFVSEGSSVTNVGAVTAAGNNIDVRYGDLNSDGLTDVIYPATTGVWNIGFGQGSGAFAVVAGPSSSAHATYQTVIGDYDGDGYDDLYVTDNSSWTWRIFRSTGTALASTAINPSTPIPGAGLGWMATDQDGDNLPDLGRYNSASPFTWTMYSHKGLPGERLKSATDGLGNKVTFNYLPMSDPDVYVIGTTPAYPDQFFVSAQPLVHEMVVEPNVPSSNYKFTYFYTEARRHAAGRSYLGMGWREFVDDRDGSQIIETYKQAFPVVGAIESLRLFQSAGGTKAFHATYQYDHHQLDATPGNERFLPYNAGSNQKTYEVNPGGAKNGQLISEVVEARNVNTFGNLATRTITAYDRDSGSSEFGMSYVSSISATYKENTTNWCINVPTSRTETRTLPDFSSETRSTTWTVNSCLVTQEAIEPTGTPEEALVTDFEHDACGNVDYIAVYPAADLAAKRETFVGYGTRCQRPEYIKNPENHETAIAYSWSLALPSSHTDPNEYSDTTATKRTTFEYDGFGRLTRQKRIDDTAIRFAPSTCGSSGNWCGTGNNAARFQVVRTERNTSDAILRTDTDVLDGLGRVIATKSDTLNSGPAIAKFLYDKLDRQTGATQPHFSGSTQFVTVYTFDVLGRLKMIDAPIDINNPSGRTTLVSYEGRDVIVTDPEGRTTTRTSDVMGRLRQVTDPTPGGNTRYVYYPFGEIESIFDANGNDTRWTYNKRGFVTGTSDPDSGDWTYVVSAFGETTKIRDAKTASPAFTTTFVYDKLSRITSRIDVPESLTTTFTWGTSAHNTNTAKYIGRLKSTKLSNNQYEEINTFDAHSRLKKLQTKIGSETFDLDFDYVAASGLLNWLQYPANSDGFRLTVQNTYQNNILSSVKDFNNSLVFWSALDTDAWGHYQNATFGNGVSVIKEYDQASGLLSRRYGGTSGSNRIDAILDWDLNSNFESRIDNRIGAATEVFQYDTINRLDRSTLNTAENLDVVYNNPIGNIQTKGGLTYTYTRQTGCTYNFPHLQPRAVHKIGSTVYCYDANGNMIKRGGSDVVYSSYNLPTTINSGSNSSALYYGTFRNRYRQVAVASGVSEETLYVGGLFERVLPSTGGIQFRHYIPGGDGVAAIHTRSGGSGSTYYVHSDHLGSPEVFTASNGNELVRLSFGAYGERRDGSDWSGPPSAADMNVISGITRRGFTGHEHLDAVGLIHMNGRVYDPVAGRFLGADPVVEIGNSQSPNSYSYVWNNPLSLIDPTGFTAADVTGTDAGTPSFPNCFIDLDNLGVDCNNPDLNHDWRWYVYDRQVDLTVLFRLRQAYLGNQWPQRVPLLSNFTAKHGRALLEQAQDYIVDQDCGVACGIVYAASTAVYEGLIDDFLVSADEVRAGNYDKAAIAVVFATVKPLKGLKGLNDLQAANLSRFMKHLPNGAKDLLVRDLPGGGRVFQSTVPGRVPGSKAVYEKQVDASGRTLGYTITTYGPAGNIVHAKDKISGAVVP